MADRRRNQEKETCRAVASFPSVESLQGRLNQIDVRLRKLEEQERPREICFTGDLRATNKTLTATMDDAYVKHRLMNRLQLLETKIRQLSSELQKGSDNSYRVIASPTDKQKKKKSSNSCIRMARGKPWRCSEENAVRQRSKGMMKRIIRWIRSCIFCTDDDHYCSLNSSLSDDCEAQGIHAQCYH